MILNISRLTYYDDNAQPKKQNPQFLSSYCNKIKKYLINLCRGHRGSIAIFKTKKKKCLWPPLASQYVFMEISRIYAGIKLGSVKSDINK